MGRNKLALICFIVILHFSCIRESEKKRSGINGSELSVAMRGSDSVKSKEVRSNNIIRQSLNFGDNHFDLLKVSELHASFRELYNEWDSMDSKQKKEYFEQRFMKDKYIGYFFYEWGKYYFYTQNPRIKRIFNEALSFVNKNYKDRGRLMTREDVKKGPWYRERFARNSRLMFNAWINTGSKEMLNTVDSQIEIWLSNNRTKRNKRYKIFAYSNSSDNNEINPNQNLQLALVFSNVFFEPQSKFYQNENLRKLAYNETNAALSIMKENGFLPLSEKHIKVGDSNYAGLSTTVLYELSQMWGREDWIVKLKMIGKWLNTAFDESRPWNSKKDGEDYHFDRKKVYNLYSRIPAFYAAGIPASRAKEWMNFVSTKFPGFEILGQVPRWGFLRTLPESYYSEKARKRKLKIYAPKIYTYVDETTLRCNIVGSEIIAIFIDDKEYEVKDQEMVYDTKKIKSLKIKVSDKYQQVSQINVPISDNVLQINLSVFDFNHPLRKK